MTGRPCKAVQCLDLCKSGAPRKYSWTAETVCPQQIKDYIKLFPLFSISAVDPGTEQQHVRNEGSFFSRLLFIFFLFWPLRAAVRNAGWVLPARWSVSQKAINQGNMIPAYLHNTAQTHTLLHSYQKREGHGT